MWLSYNNIDIDLVGPSLSGFAEWSKMGGELKGKEVACAKAFQAAFNWILFNNHASVFVYRSFLIKDFRKNLLIGALETGLNYSLPEHLHPPPRNDK